MILVSLWILFCFSGQRIIGSMYLGLLFVTSIMGIVMVNELAFTYDLLFDGDKDLCIDAMEEMEIEKSFTRIVLCQESMIYIFYYLGYGVFILFATIIGGLWMRNTLNTLSQQPDVQDNEEGMSHSQGYEISEAILGPCVEVSGVGST